MLRYWKWWVYHFALFWWPYYQRFWIYRGGGGGPKQQPRIFFKSCVTCPKVDFFEHWSHETTEDRKTKSRGATTTLIRRLSDSTDLIYIMLTKAKIFNPWARSVVNSYIALRSFVFLFNSLIFFTSFYHYHPSWLASEFLPDLLCFYHFWERATIARFTYNSNFFRFP